MRHRIVLTTSLFLLSAAFVPPAKAAASDAEPRTVRVTGTGDSAYEARTDAIRQALQQTMKQLVVADRAIENDQILRDRVLSTMNGFVDQFRIVSSRAVPHGSARSFEIEADVTVSASRIENFLGSSSAGKAALNGNNLLANVQRENAARQAKREILFRLFDAYPANALEVKVNSVTPDAQNPDQIHIAFKVKPRDAFIAQLKAGLRELGGRVVTVDPTARGWERFNSFAAVCFSDQYRGEAFMGDEETGSALQNVQMDSVGGTQSLGCTVLEGIDIPAVGKNPYGFFDDRFYLRVLYSWDVTEDAYAFVPTASCAPAGAASPVGNRRNARPCTEGGDRYGSGNPLFVIAGLGRDPSQAREPRGVQIWLETRPRYYTMTLSSKAIPENARGLDILPFLAQLQNASTFNRSNVVLLDSEPAMVHLFGPKKTAPFGDVKPQLEQELKIVKSGEIK